MFCQQFFHKFFQVFKGLTVVLTIIILQMVLRASSMRPARIETEGRPARASRLVARPAHHKKKTPRIFFGYEMSFSIYGSKGHVISRLPDLLYFH